MNLSIVRNPILERRQTLRIGLSTLSKWYSINISSTEWSAMAAGRKLYGKCRVIKGYGP